MYMSSIEGTKPNVIIGIGFVSVYFLRVSTMRYLIILYCIIQCFTEIVVEIVEFHKHKENTLFCSYTYQYCTGSTCNKTGLGEEQKDYKTAYNDYMERLKMTDEKHIW